MIFNHSSVRSFDKLLCGCQVTAPPSYFLMTLFLPHPRETDCYTWHGTMAVTLTWHAPLSKPKFPAAF